MTSLAAKVAAENALNGDNLRYDSLAMPDVVCTDPQMASFGLIEAAAHERGMDVRSAMVPLDYVPRAIATSNTRCLIKLVAERNTGKLVGGTCRHKRPATGSRPLRWRSNTAYL